MPQLERAPCHRVFGEFDAAILDVAEGMAWFARINIRACERNPRLRAELLRRGDAALVGYRAGTLGVLPGTGVWQVVAPQDAEPTAGERQFMSADGALVRRDWRAVAAGYDPKTGRPRQRWQEFDRKTGKPRARWLPPVPPYVYEDEPTDNWRAFSAQVEARPGQTIRADCDCLTPDWAAYWWIRGVKRIGVGVSQPKTVPCGVGGKSRCGRGMAHTYNVIDTGGELPGIVGLPGVMLDARGVGIFDASTLAGMGEDDPRGPSRMGPQRAFYGSGESAHLNLDGTPWQE